MKPIYEKTKKRFSYRIYSYSGAPARRDFLGLHWHRNMEICKVLAGTCDFTVSDQSYTAEKGDIIFVNTGELHSIDRNHGACQIIILTFDPAVLYNLGEQVGAISTHVKYSDIKKVGIADEVEKCFENLESEINSTEKYSKILFEASLLKVCGLFLRNFEESSKSKGDTKKEISFQKMLKYISENYDEDINLDIIAKEFNYSPVYISRLFSERAGVNFKYYLDNIRTRKAVELLISGELSVSEISATCGYDNIRTFNNVFKRIMGCTPSDVRKKDVKNFPL